MNILVGNWYKFTDPWTIMLNHCGEKKTRFWNGIASVLLNTFVRININFLWFLLSLNLLTIHKISRNMIVIPRKRTFVLYCITRPDKHGRVSFSCDNLKWLVQYSLLYTCKQDTSIFTTYQKRAAMFNWSPCTWIGRLCGDEV